MIQTWIRVARDPFSAETLLWLGVGQPGRLVQSLARNGSEVLQTAPGVASASAVVRILGSSAPNITPPMPASTK